MKKFCKCRDEYLTIENGRCEKCHLSIDPLTKKIITMLNHEYGYGEYVSDDKNNDSLGFAKKLIREIKEELK